MEDYITSHFSKNNLPNNNPDSGESRIEDENVAEIMEKLKDLLDSLEAINTAHSQIWTDLTQGEDKLKEHGGEAFIEFVMIKSTTLPVIEPTPLLELRRLIMVFTVIQKQSPKNAITFLKNYVFTKIINDRDQTQTDYSYQIEQLSLYGTIKFGQLENSYIKKYAHLYEDLVLSEHISNSIQRYRESGVLELFSRPKQHLEAIRELMHSKGFPN